MKPGSSVPLNTLDKAVRLARSLSRDLASKERKACRSHQIFSALTTNEQEALAAFLIWRAQGEVLHELMISR